MKSGRASGRLAPRWTGTSVAPNQSSTVIVFRVACSTSMFPASVVERLRHRRLDLGRIHDLTGPQAKAAGDGRIVDRGEIDRIVAVAVVQVLELLDPAVAPIRALNQDDRQIQAADRLE